MSTISERDRLSKELKLVHQERMKASAAATNLESLLRIHCLVYKTLGMNKCPSPLADEKEQEILKKEEEFEISMEKLTEAQEHVLDLEEQLLNQ